MRKLGSCVALAAMAMFGAATNAAAQDVDTSCSKAPLWRTEGHGPNSVWPVSTRYDVMYDMRGGGPQVDLGPRNQGGAHGVAVFDAFVCNVTPYEGEYFVRYVSGGETVSKAPARACYQLRAITSLVIEGKSDWKACVFVRYRD